MQSYSKFSIHLVNRVGDYNDSTVPFTLETKIDNTFYLRYYSDGQQFKVVDSTKLPEVSYAIRDLTICTEEELFQLNTIWAIKYPMEEIKNLQEGLKSLRYSTKPYETPSGWLHCQLKFVIEREPEDYELSDEDFYEKYFPGKVWRN